MATVKLALLVTISGMAGAQSLNVYSEFARIDKAGHVIAPETPREILSPALARNAFTSFQVAVEADSESHWKLYVGQNPENAVKITMYRESGADLKPIELPVEGDGTQVFWMDLWTEGNARVQRIKVEPELYIKDDWVTYPMEARVMDATVPQGVPKAVSLPPNLAMKNYLCVPGKSSQSGSSDVMRLQYRNALQDVALAEHTSKDELRKLFGSCDAPLPEDPEWYLRIRDYLFRLR